jgi:DNA/RNA-binding protein KIN17
MPKAERGSLKDIGKRIKMKGLQKLKFYCQLCEKQCRDANGFKCHLTSDHHLQQMNIFSKNANQMMDRYSSTFEKNFIDTVRMRHSTSKVAANTVYQEMIQDKQHIHMNATIWTTLSDFVKYLGKTGQCIVEETERGWYITYIERNSTKLLQIEQTQRRIEADHVAELEYNHRIEQQRIAAAIAYERVTTNHGSTTAAPAATTTTTTTTTLNEETGNTNTTSTTTGNNNPTVRLAFLHPSNPIKKNKKSTLPLTSSTTLKKSVLDEDDDDENDDDVTPEIEAATSISPRTAVVALPQSKETQTSSDNGKKCNLERQPSTHNPVATTTTTTETSNHAYATKTKQQNDNNKNDDDNDDDNDDTPWLYPNIMVRIINKTLDRGTYYRQKGHVVQVLPNDPYVAQVQILQDEDDKNDKHNMSDRNTNATSTSTILLQLWYGRNI